ncbi:MAG: LacI family transcriptional regulator [Blautia sp.]|nr:LacI family transcriptional regulator [Lachnoclostridium sp.]MCM1211067.1 LacI family transcriptional regulator [Blautia sp.]
MSEEKALTISDIANELGVSKTTVSRVISGKGRIGAETREKVLQYIEEHNYRPNLIARGLAQSRTYNIALVIPGDYNIMELPFFQQCMIGISKVASFMEYDVLLSIVTKKDISGLQKIIVNHKVDGVILTRTLVEDASIQYLKEEGVPFVTIGSVEDATVVQIDNDHRQGCKELTQCLFAQNMDRIALIGGSQDYMVTRNRLQGFRDAFLQNGRSIDEELIYLDVEEEKEVASIVEKLLEKGAECIVAMDDYLCNCILHALHQKKVAVPEQMKVASFYDSSFLANNVPSVTSVRFDVEELGELTCRQLLRMIEGEKVPAKTLLGYRISLRRSTKNS